MKLKGNFITREIDLSIKLASIGKIKKQGNKGDVQDKHLALTV